VPTIAERILSLLAEHGPMTDRVLAEHIRKMPQSINPTANRLATEGRIQRLRGPDGKILNALPDQYVEPPTAPSEAPDAMISEDSVKAAVQAHLEALGYTVDVAWGRTRGIDIEAKHVSLARLVIEAKGEVLSDQQQGNYFLGALGELIQRLDDPDAIYALALPDNKRYRGLVARLPALARQRLNLTVYWVTRTTDGTPTVTEERNA
jgi:hypothetical protein